MICFLCKKEIKYYFNISGLCLQCHRKAKKAYKNYVKNSLEFFRCPINFKRYKFMLKEFGKCADAQKYFEETPRSNFEICHMIDQNM